MKLCLLISTLGLSTLAFAGPDVTCGPLKFTFALDAGNLVQLVTLDSEEIRHTITTQVIETRTTLIDDEEYAQLAKVPQVQEKTFVFAGHKMTADTIKVIKSTLNTLVVLPPVQHAFQLHYLDIVVQDAGPITKGVTWINLDGAAPRKTPCTVHNAKVYDIGE